MSDSDKLTGSGPAVTFEKRGNNHYYRSTEAEMLVLERKVGERIRIGDDIWVSVTKKRGDGKLTIGIEAPRHIPVMREELIKESGEENPRAA